MNYTFHPHAEKELEEIEKHYDDILTGFGDRFREAVEIYDFANSEISKQLAASFES
jgi:hypothetical protein